MCFYRETSVNEGLINLLDTEKVSAQEGVRLKEIEYFRPKNVRKRESASFRVIIGYFYRTITILSSKLLLRNRIGYKITALGRE